MDFKKFLSEASKGQKIYLYAYFEGDGVGPHEYFDCLSAFATEAACLKTMLSDLKNGQEVFYAQHFGEINSGDPVSKTVKTINDFYDLIDGNDWSDNFLYEDRTLS